MDFEIRTIESMEDEIDRYLNKLSALEAELAECQARWRLAQELDLAARSSDLGRLLEERWPTPALDAALEQARAEERERCAQIAEHWPRYPSASFRRRLAEAIRALAGGGE